MCLRNFVVNLGRRTDRDAARELVEKGNGNQNEPRARGGTMVGRGRSDAFSELLQHRSGQLSRTLDGWRRVHELRPHARIAPSSLPFPL
jgi:hypothetical protein